MSKKYFNNDIQLNLLRDLPHGATFVGKALSDSMSPLINPGDEVGIKKIPIELLKRYDIVAFIKNKKFYSHRIVMINKKDKSILTKGDNLEKNDEPVKRDNYIGRVIWVRTNHNKLSLESSTLKLFAWKIHQLFPRRFGLRSKAHKAENKMKMILKTFLSKLE